MEAAVMPGKPRKRAGSRRDRQVMGRPGPWHRNPSDAIGPEAQPAYYYEVRVIVECRFCGMVLGEVRRHTIPPGAGVPGYDNETTMVSRMTDPDGTKVDPRQRDDKHEKWRFTCSPELGGCGNDVPASDQRVEKFMDELCVPWASRTEHWAV